MLPSGMSDRFSFLDTRNNSRDGKVLLNRVRTVISGVPFGGLYQAPFAAR